MEKVNHQYKPRKRTKRRISYEDFLELIKTGVSLSQMKKLNISEKQINFYSLLYQDKINLTIYQFKSEYLSGMSLADISKKHRIAMSNITQLREYYKIPYLGCQYIKRKKTEKPLTDQQKRIIYGGLMGDGRGNRAVFLAKQSIKQKKYLIWKYNQLKNHVNNNTLKEYSYYNKKYNKTYKSIKFYTKANTDIETIVHKFYNTGKKIITQEILDELDELSLAVWYMDDGYTNWHFSWRSKKKNSKIRPDAELCTDSFSKEECKLISRWFKNKFNIKTVLKSGKLNINGITKFRIKFDVDNTQDFFYLIHPFIIPSMLYKIDYKAYLKYRAAKQQEQHHEEELSRAK